MSSAKLHSRAAKSELYKIRGKVTAETRGVYLENLRACVQIGTGVAHVGHKELKPHHQHRRGSCPRHLQQKQGPCLSCSAKAMLKQGQHH